MTAALICITTMNQNLLTHAQMALERNDLVDATTLFRLHVGHYPEIAAGWLGLFQSSDQPAERVECLKQLLRITQAEIPASAQQPAETEDDDVLFESIEAQPLSSPERIPPFTETVAVSAEAESGEDLGEEPPDTIESIDTEIESGWPALQTQIVQWTIELVDAGNYFMQTIDAELVPALKSLKHKTHSFFTTQFSTSSGHKLRPVPIQPSQKLLMALNWVGRLAGVAVLGLLAVVLIPVFMGNRAFVIVSGSMVPTISTGSVAVVKPVESSQLQVGDVIAYSPNPGAIPLVHRIVNIRDEAGVRFFTTQGDANATADPLEVALPPNTWQLWYSLPWLGYVINFAFSKMGFVVFVLVPLIGLGALTLKDKLRQPAKRRLLRANS